MTWPSFAAALCDESRALLETLNLWFAVVISVHPHPDTLLRVFLYPALCSCIYFIFLCFIYSSGHSDVIANQQWVQDIEQMLLSMPGLGNRCLNASDPIIRFWFALEIDIFLSWENCIHLYAKLCAFWSIVGSVQKFIFSICMYKFIVSFFQSINQMV